MAAALTAALAWPSPAIAMRPMLNRAGLEETLHPAADSEASMPAGRVDVTKVEAQVKTGGISAATQRFLAQFANLPPEVFDPQNQWTLLVLETMERLAPLFQDAEVLDTGTGSLVLIRAALELFGARRGVATELPGYPFDALQRAMLLPPTTAARLELLTGSLVEPVHGRTFDAAIFNPPSQDVAEGYLREIGDALRPSSGFALLMWLKVAKDRFQAIARSRGLVLEPILQDGRYLPGMGWQVYAITRTPERMTEIQRMVQAVGLEEPPADQPKDGLAWFADLIERAAAKAGTVQVSRRRFLKVAAATAQAIGAARLVSQLKAVLPTTPTVAVTPEVLTDAWVGYLTPERLKGLATLDKLRTLEWTGSPLALRMAANVPDILAAHAAQHGFEFLEGVRQLTQQGANLLLRPDPMEIQQLLRFFRDENNRARFVAHPAVRASLDPAHRTPYDASGLFDGMLEWIEGTASLSPPVQLSAQLAANPETAHLAWRVQRVLDGDTAFLDHDLWFQAEQAYWQGWRARDYAMRQVLQDNPQAQSQNSNAWQKVEADFKDWERQHQAEQRAVDTEPLARRLTGLFTTAAGDGLPTREAVAAAVAEMLTAEPARYGVFTAALDRLGPAVDAQALAMVCGRLLLAWTDPTITMREDVARRLTALIMALPPEESARRRAWFDGNLHDLHNTLYVVNTCAACLIGCLPAGAPDALTLQHTQSVLSPAASAPVYDRWAEASRAHDDAGKLHHGLLLVSQYSGALREVVTAWPPISTTVWNELSHHPSAEAVREVLAALRRNLPQAAALSEIIIGDLAGVPQPGGPLDLTRLAHDLVRRWDGEARRHGVPSTIVTTPSQSLWVRAANPVDLGRIVGNLVANAAEALKRTGRTADGRIEITVAREGPWVTLTVQDNGPGLPDELLALVNQPALVERLPSAKPPETPGEHGIGLLSVKRQVEEWGGKFMARRRAEGGTEIILRLPAIEPPATADASPAPASSGLEELPGVVGVEPALRQGGADATLGVEA